MSRRLHARATAVAAAITVALAAAASGARAGQACDSQPATVAEVERGLALAESVQRRLVATGAEVVVLARAGQDLSRWGLHWSHLGFAYRASDAGGRTAWRVVHKLNPCGSASGALYRQGLGEFFLDRPHRYEAAVVVLAPALQARLRPLLADNARLARWHTPRYSMVAYPWATTYQQSNQWALETLAGAAGDGVATRADAQAWLHAQGYRGQVLRIDALTRLGARVGMAHVAFDDHPTGERFADRIETVTVDSVFAWLQDSGLGSRPLVVR